MSDLPPPEFPARDFKVANPQLLDCTAAESAATDLTLQDPPLANPQLTAPHLHHPTALTAAARQSAIPGG
jgi:hypothetical protein